MRSETLMIRPATAYDVSAITEIAVDSTLFTADDVETVSTMMTEYFGRRTPHSDRCVVADTGAGPQAVAYFQPAEATDRTWYLTMIAVRRCRQRTGLGAALMQHVEGTLRRGGERLMLVETSGTTTFDGTRAFYRRLGYAEEARVRDYYADGDDMVVLRKALSSA